MPALDDSMVTQANRASIFSKNAARPAAGALPAEDDEEEKSEDIQKLPPIGRIPIDKRKDMKNISSWNDANHLSPRSSWLASRSNSKVKANTMINVQKSPPTSVQKSPPTRFAELLEVSSQINLDDTSKNNNTAILL